MNYITIFLFLIVSIATSTFAQEIILFEDKGRKQITYKDSSKALSKYSGYILNFPLESLKNTTNHITLRFLSKKGDLVSMHPDIGIKLNEKTLCGKKFRCKESDLLVSMAYSERERTSASAVFFADKHLSVSEKGMTFTYKGESYFLETKERSIKIHFYNDPDELGQEVFILANINFN